MRRSGIARLNLIKILCAASNACLNLLEILPIAANLLAIFFHKFCPLCGVFYLAVVLCGANRVLKTERERLKFHGAICKPCNPKDMHARIIF